MYIAITTVKLIPGSVDTVCNLFKETNPALVQGEEDWVKASFAADRANDEVTVMAIWRSADAYHNFSASTQFRMTMSKFGPYFAGPPQISVKEILFEM